MLYHYIERLHLTDSGPTYFTIILQSSVGTLEGHSEVGAMK